MIAKAVGCTLEGFLELAPVEVIESVLDVELQHREAILREGLRSHVESLGTCPRKSELACCDELGCELRPEKIRTDAREDAPQDRAPSDGSPMASITLGDRA